MLHKRGTTRRSVMRSLCRDAHMNSFAFNRMVGYGARIGTKSMLPGNGMWRCALIRYVFLVELTSPYSCVYVVCCALAYFKGALMFSTASLPANQSLQMSIR